MSVDQHCSSTQEMDMEKFIKVFNHILSDKLDQSTNVMVNDAIRQAGMLIAEQPRNREELKDVKSMEKLICMECKENKPESECEFSCLRCQGNICDSCMENTDTHDSCITRKFFHLFDEKKYKPWDDFVKSTSDKVLYCQSCFIEKAALILQDYVYKRGSFDKCSKCFKCGNFYKSKCYNCKLLHENKLIKTMFDIEELLKYIPEDKRDNPNIINCRGEKCLNDNAFRCKHCGKIFCDSCNSSTESCQQKIFLDSLKGKCQELDDYMKQVKLSKEECHHCFLDRAFQIVGKSTTPELRIGCNKCRKDVCILVVKENFYGVNGYFRRIICYECLPQNSWESKDNIMTILLSVTKYVLDQMNWIQGKDRTSFMLVNISPYIITWQGLLWSKQESFPCRFAECHINFN